MIKLRDNSICILRPDGTSCPFEIEDLQTRIIRSCLSAGSGDVWIAEDISLSVEYALSSRESHGGKGSVEESELLSIVAKILEDTGYPEVAESFRGSSPQAEPSFDLSDIQMVSELLGKRLGIEGTELDALAKAVAASLSSLELPFCTPQLVLEMARCQRRGKVRLESIRLPGAQSLEGSSPYLASAADICSSFPEAVQGLLSAGVLKPRALSRLFPALRVDLSLAALASHCGLSKPATELSMLNGLKLAAAAIDALCARADKLCAASGRKDATPAPLWLCLVDLSSFSREWLDCQAEDSFEMLEILSGMLGRAPFKTTCK